jgi:PAS domain S-box-containing protein
LNKDSSKLKILIIEDNIGDFMLINEYLEEQYESPDVLHIKSFSEFKLKTNDTNSFFDVILLDLSLPDKTGESLIAEIINRFAETPVIILTGFADLNFSKKSLTLKVSDYLLKDEINSSILYKSITYNIERKKSSLLLEASEKRYSNLFQLSPQPMWIFDIISLQFLQVNKAAIEQYGYSEAEFVNMKLYDIVIDDLSIEEKFIKANEIAHNENIYKGRIKHTKKSGQIIDVDVYSSLILINGRDYESSILIDVTEKIKLEHKITKAIIKTQEDERYEIGTELHDNVCQILASSLLSLEMLKENITPESVQWINKSKQFLNLALDEIRNISHRLAPSFFDFTTIEDTFKELLEGFNLEKKHEISLSVDFEKLKHIINSDIQLNLYRILQEQLRNIQKYANASKIEVIIKTESDAIIFIIADNGIGFDVHQTKKGIGLSNIRRRTELFSGNMEIETSPGNGCRINIKLPVY